MVKEESLSAIDLNMIIKNITENRIITLKAKIAISFHDRLFGLIDKNNSRFLVLNTHFGIHTFFLKSPIDIILLDGRNKVIKMSENLPPYKFFFYNPKYSKVIEMPQNSIKKLGVHMNDKICIG